VPACYGKKRHVLFMRSILLACLLLAGLAVSISAQISLKEAFRKYFRIGAALNQGHFTETDAEVFPESLFERNLRGN
jgi:hypothetical protein